MPEATIEEVELRQQNSLQQSFHPREGGNVGESDSGAPAPSHAATEGQGRWRERRPNGCCRRWGRGLRAEWVAPMRYVAAAPVQRCARAPAQRERSAPRPLNVPQRQHWSASNESGSPLEAASSLPSCRSYRQVYSLSFPATKMVYE